MALASKIILKHQKKNTTFYLKNILCPEITPKLLKIIPKLQIPFLKKI